MWYETTKLLTVDVWKTFQHMFEESRFEVYEQREQVIVPVEIRIEESDNEEQADTRA
jgi:hypothetical protein